MTVERLLRQMSTFEGGIMRVTALKIIMLAEEAAIINRFAPPKGSVMKGRRKHFYIFLE